jgi:hypothetical protein
MSTTTTITSADTTKSVNTSPSATRASQAPPALAVARTAVAVMKNCHKNQHSLT